MEQAPVGMSLGELLDHCLDASRTDWLKLHKAGRDEEQAWTLEVVETHLACQLKHGGRANVQVTVISRRYGNTETNVYTLRQRGPRRWLMLNNTL